MGASLHFASILPRRILLVDDFEPWRNLVRSMLSGHKQWELVGEATDGSEAVQMAVELKPDLILMDIGLPELNRRRKSHRQTGSGGENDLFDSEQRRRSDRGSLERRSARLHSEIGLQKRVAACDRSGPAG
jgi:hypothetical protein